MFTHIITRGLFGAPLKAVLLAWVIFLLLPAVARAQQSIAPKRMLVLYWYGKDFPSSVIQFVESSFWNIYKWQIIGVVTVCMVEGLLIFALLAQRARRRRVEDALRDNEERLNLALSAAHMGAWDWRLQTNELTWSEETRKVFGLANGKSAVTPEAFLDLIYPDDRPAVSQAITRTINKGAPYDVEFRTVHQDGSMHWVMGKGKALLDKAGQAARMLGVNMDITDRKRVEERLRSCFELPLIGMAITSPDRRFVEVNQKLCDILGYSMDQLTGMSWVDVTHPDDVAENTRLLDETLRGQTEGYVMDKRFIHRDGRIVYASISARCARRADRIVDYLSLVVQEITERKQAEEALRLSEDKFSKAFRSSPDAFAISRQSDGMILEVNGRWEEIIGYARDEAVGRTVSELQIYLNPSERAQLVSLVRERGSARDFEVVLRKKSGEIRNVSVSAEPIMIRDEPCLMLIVRDITERKRAQQSLRESEEALRKSYARIEDLAGRLIAAQEDERRHIARELHDDLNQQVAALAIGISRLKRQFPDAGAAVQEQFARLREKTDWLSERIRQVSHELHSSILQHVGLPAALNSYCAEFTDREGITVTLDIRDGVEALSPDAALCLYRVAQQSLRNVARHSGARSAIVALARNNGAIELRVADQGVGFDPGRAQEGSGLGLVSMEERVKLLHGCIVLTTRPGAGTELRAQIPLRGEHEQNKSSAG